MCTTFNQLKIKLDLVEIQLDFHCKIGMLCFLVSEVRDH